MPQNNSPALPSSSAKISRCDFLAFLDTCLANLNTPRGRMIARIRTLQNAGLAPTCITTWFELFRFLDRQKFARDDIQVGRALWHAYVNSKARRPPANPGSRAHADA